MHRIVNPILAAVLLAAATIPLPSAGTFETEMLIEHNVIRGEVRVPPLRWSARLAIAARKWADTLAANGRFEHQTHNPYGENLFTAAGTEAPPIEVVRWWAAEASDYDYKTNTCRGTCGHYTQLVWRNTREVGCAEARGQGRQVVVCEYDPPGNWRGERPW